MSPRRGTRRRTGLGRTGIRAAVVAFLALLLSASAAGVAYADVVFYPFLGTGTDTAFEPYFLAGLLASFVVALPFLLAGAWLLWFTRRRRLAHEVATADSSAGVDG